MFHLGGGFSKKFSIEYWINGKISGNISYNSCRKRKTFERKLPTRKMVFETGIYSFRYIHWRISLFLSNHQNGWFKRGWDDCSSESKNFGIFIRLKTTNTSNSDSTNIS